MILSWDIGIYNLSYCLLEKNTLSNKQSTINDTSINDTSINDTSIGDTSIGDKNIYKFDGYCIKDWGIINIADKINIKKNKMGVYENIPDILDTYTDFLNCKYVLIENQPCMKNPTMKSIQMILYSYFLIKGLKNNESNITNVKFISPMNKLKVYDGPKITLKVKSKYTIRKKSAVIHSQYFLQNNNKYLNLFNSNKKKDDLADSFLQGLYYIKKNKL